MRFPPRVLSFSALSLIALAGCSKNNTAGGAPQGPPPAAVQTKVAEPAPVNDASEYIATLKSRNSASVMPQVDGQITQIFVKSGDHVQAGAALMQIDPLKQQATTGSTEAARSAKQAAVRLAEQEYDRTNKLFAEGVTSRQSLDQAKAALDSAREELKAIEANVRAENVQLRYYKVTAPTSGVVGDIPVHQGDRVSPQTMLTTVDQPGSIEAYIEVPVERSRELKNGQKIELLDSEGKPLTSTQINFISPQVNSETQTVLVKAPIEKGAQGLRTAQLARARVVWGQQPRITIPVLSVTRINGQPFGFVVENGEKGGQVAKQRQLVLGEIVGNEYIVLDGIKPGEKVIVSSAQGLAEGVPVAPKS
jgi:RND family efflux transporter MFP subunit